MADQTGRILRTPVERMMDGILSIPDRSGEPTADALHDVCDRVPRMERTAVTRSDLASGALETSLILSSDGPNGIVKVLMIPSAIWMLLPPLVCDHQTDFEHLPNLQLCSFCPALRGPWILVAGMLCILRHRWPR